MYRDPSDLIKSSILDILYQGWQLLDLMKELSDRWMVLEEAFPIIPGAGGSDWGQRSRAVIGPRGDTGSLTHDRMSVNIPNRANNIQYSDISWLLLVFEV